MVGGGKRRHRSGGRGFQQLPRNPQARGGDLGPLYAPHAAEPGQLPAHLDAGQGDCRQPAAGAHRGLCRRCQPATTFQVSSRPARW